MSARDIAQAVGQGWQLFLASIGPSLAFTSIAVIVGLLVLWAVSQAGLPAMALPLAGGFMLMAPAMLGGYFHVAKNLQEGRDIGLVTPFDGFRRSPLQLWVLALFCSFTFLIWLTDAGVLYSFTLGGANNEPAWLWFARVDRPVLGFWFWGSLMGGFLAFVIFCVAAFSVPLLFERRASLIQAINASVRAVFSNFFTCMLWALSLAAAIVTAVMLLPVLLVLFPVLAYASYLLYQRVFPYSY